MGKITFGDADSVGSSGQDKESLRSLINAKVEDAVAQELKLVREELSLKLDGEALKPVDASLEDLSSRIDSLKEEVKSLDLSSTVEGLKAESVVVAKEVHDLNSKLLDLKKSSDEAVSSAKLDLEALRQSLASEVGRVELALSSMADKDALSEGSLVNQLDEVRLVIREVSQEISDLSAKLEEPKAAPIVVSDSDDRFDNVEDKISNLDYFVRKEVESLVSSIEDVQERVEILDDAMSQLEKRDVEYAKRLELDKAEIAGIVKRIDESSYRQNVYLGIISVSLFVSIILMFFVGGR